MSGTQTLQPNLSRDETCLDEGIRLLSDLSKEELIRIVIDDAKNWLAHDGLWFQAVEAEHGMEKAIDADREAWRRFTVIEAKRIMARLGLEPGGGIPALVECLKHRLYARLNLQECLEASDDRVVFRMVDCRVQSARKRKGLPDFPCKSVGVVEYAEFARTVDPRIETRCIACPPDEHPEEFWCAWEFTVARE
ncbi:MAG: hypothetical protein GWN87_00150 [Desulfuromonadales bacterium]|nr:hypothetical protein [Desulfuromonadales bacterium]NIS39196.1 hypothetical protein [Desulfuromonadales bacterium]